MKIIVLLCIFFMLISCGKKRDIKIIAKNAVTGLPYAGLSYKIVSSRTAADGEKYKTEASGYLDANGEAIAEIKQKNNRTYSVYVQEPENTCYNKQITQYFDTKYDQNGAFTFEFAECAFIKNKIKNINCINEFDKITIFRQYSISDYNQDDNGWELVGCVDRNPNDFSDLPFGQINYKWIVTRNGITNTFYDTIYLSPGEYKTYEINY